MLTRIQLLAPEAYYTQLKDTDDPWNECQVTSGANWLEALKISVATPQLPDGSLQRLPDYIDDLTKRPEALAMAKREGWTGPPRELHDVLAWAINEAVDREVDRFATDVSLEQVLLDIFHGHPVILAGTFWPDGHVVCATGVETLQLDVSELTRPEQVDLKALLHILVADPIGDWHNHYADHFGYECRYTFDELLQLCNAGGVDSKWAHRYAA